MLRSLRKAAKGYNYDFELFFDFFCCAQGGPHKILYGPNKIVHGPYRIRYGPYTILGGPYMILYGNCLRKKGSKQASLRREALEFFKASDAAF